MINKLVPTDGEDLDPSRWPQDQMPVNYKVIDPTQFMDAFRPYSPKWTGYTQLFPDGLMNGGIEIIVFCFPTGQSVGIQHPIGQGMDKCFFSWGCNHDWQPIQPHISGFYMHRVKCRNCDVEWEYDSSD